MALTKRSLETLIDLVEIKLSCIQVTDREDARELTTLEACKRELLALAGQRGPGAVVAFPAKTPTRTQRLAAAG